MEVHAALLPEQKTAFVAAQVKKGKTVAMLGDGINDAPALSEVTVGVAMEAGTDEDLAERHLGNEGVHLESSLPTVPAGEDLSADERNPAPFEQAITDVIERLSVWKRRLEFPKQISTLL